MSLESNLEAAAEGAEGRKRPLRKIHLGHISVRSRGTVTDGEGSGLRGDGRLGAQSLGFAEGSMPPAAAETARNPRCRVCHEAPQLHTFIVNEQWFP